MDTLTYTGTITLETCCQCGTAFGIEAGLQKKLVENSKGFYCPNGHKQFYTSGKTLKAKLAEKERVIQDLKCRIDLCTTKEVYLFCDWRFSGRLSIGGVLTIGDALKLGESGLRKIYGIGDVCISQIQENLSAFDVNLKP